MAKLATLAKMKRERGIINTFGFGIQYIKEIVILSYFKLRSKDGLFLKEIHGNKMYLDPSDIGLSKELLLSGTREELQTKIIKEMVKKGMVVLEIGANLGYYALIEASIIGKEGKIYAIEPVPRNFEILNKNIDINGYRDTVDTFCVAASSQCGTSVIKLTEESNRNTMLHDSNIMSDWMRNHVIEEKMVGDLEVNTITIDEFLKDKEKIDMLRMDIEGYEVEAFKGMSDTLKNVDSLIIALEVHPQLFKNPQDTIGKLMSELIQLGFEPMYMVSSMGDKLIDVSSENLSEIVCKHRSPGVFLKKMRGDDDGTNKRK